MRAQLSRKRRDAGEKKIIENEVTGYVNYRERGTEKSICCVVLSSLLNVTLNFFETACANVELYFFKSFLAFVSFSYPRLVFDDASRKCKLFTSISLAVRLRNLSCSKSSGFQIQVFPGFSCN